MKKELYYIVWEEQEGWVSKCLHTGVTSCGTTKAEAVEMLKEAVGLYLENEEDLEVEIKVSEFGKVPFNA